MITRVVYRIVVHLMLADESCINLVAGYHDTQIVVNIVGHCGPHVAIGAPLVDR